MTLEKSSRWITEEAIKLHLLIYDLSGKPVPYDFDEGADIVLDVVNHRWWEATDKESEIIGGDWAEHWIRANDVSISKADAEKYFSIKLRELEEPVCLEVVIRADLIDIVSLSKAVAKYRNMTNAEACDWVTTELNKVEALAFYDISGYSLPERLSEKRAEFAACECFNQNWWRSPEIEDLAVPGFGGISAKEIAINKTAAEKYCLIPRKVLEEIQEETHLLFIEPQKVISKIPLETNIISHAQNSHISELLMILNEAGRIFWDNADPEQKDTQPINDTVIKWLIDKGFSKISAKQGASIIRPEWAAQGRRSTD